MGGNQPPEYFKAGWHKLQSLTWDLAARLGKQCGYFVLFAPFDNLQRIRMDTQFFDSLTIPSP